MGIELIYKAKLPFSYFSKLNHFKNNQKTDLSQIIVSDNDFCFFAVFMILSYLEGLY